MDRVPDSLNTLDAAKADPGEWCGLTIFYHQHFGYVAVTNATTEDLERRKANGWSANAYIPSSQPNLAARMTVGHLVEKVEELERSIEVLKDGIAYIAKDMAALETDCAHDQCDKYVMKAKELMGWMR